MGLHNVIIRDLDGSLLGSPGHAISNNTKAINDTCEYIEDWIGYHCPNNIPQNEWSTVVWEILDKNREEVIFRPWSINNTNFYNKITPMMDNLKEIYDISGIRIPRYQSIIRLNKTYEMGNVGRKPKTWKF